MEIWLVSADHKVAKYAARDLRVEVKPDQDKWYVFKHPYGCSKSYDSPRKAISALFLDNGCYNITAHKED